MASLLDTPPTNGVDKAPARLFLSRRLFDGMLTHARFVAPQECIGLLFGFGETALTRVPLENAANDPFHSFYADPESLFQALMSAEKRGEDLLAIYHSHPSGIARPSLRDLNDAEYRVTSMIIVPDTGDVRAYYFQPLGYDEVELRVASS